MTTEEADLDSFRTITCQFYINGSAGLTRIVNPRWRQLDSEVRKQAAQLAKIKAQYGALPSRLKAK